MVFPIPRPAWKNAAFYFVLSVAGLNAWSAVGIFLLDQYEAKFGGPWENFVAALWLSLAISAMSAVGYLLALQLFGRSLADATAVRRAAVAILAAAMFLALGGAGVPGKFSLLLPLSNVGNLMLAFFLDGLLVAGVALFLVGLWRRFRGAA